VLMFRLTDVPWPHVEKGRGTSPRRSTPRASCST